MLAICAIDCHANARQTAVMGQRPQFQCDVRASFACAFSNWREKNNVPLKQVARDLGLSVATVNGWELGKCFPTGYNLEVLVKYTGLPPCKLFCVMADKCVPADCLLAMRQIKPSTHRRKRLPR
jgi:DNA-binding transcriptional regulator YiaG